MTKDTINRLTVDMTLSLKYFDTHHTINPTRAVSRVIRWSKGYVWMFSIKGIVLRFAISMLVILIVFPFIINI